MVNSDRAFRAPVAILFAETRGFTRASETLDPTVALKRISEFVDLVEARVRRHESVVLNALNDTLMAAFTGPDAARHAVQASRDIQRDFLVLADTLQLDHGIGTAVALGLHYGEAVVGFMGGPFIFGDCVSIAMRLLHRARAGEIVMSKAMMDALAAAHIALGAEELPPLQIPRREPLRVFGLVLDARLDFT